LEEAKSLLLAESQRVESSAHDDCDIDLADSDAISADMVKLSVDDLADHSEGAEESKGDDCTADNADDEIDPALLAQRAEEDRIAAEEADRLAEEKRLQEEVSFWCVDYRKK
jgi:hypothetical protein